MYSKCVYFTFYWQINEIYTVSVCTFMLWAKNNDSVYFTFLGKYNEICEPLKFKVLETFNCDLNTVSSLNLE